LLSWDHHALRVDPHEALTEHVVHDILGILVVQDLLLGGLKLELKLLK
jgi:hypothetical protein